MPKNPRLLPLQVPKHQRNLSLNFYSSPKAAFQAVFILLLLLSSLSINAQSQDGTKSQNNSASSSTQMLNQRILRAYESLSVARELLKFERMEALPIGTLVTWVGNYPNRKGVKITKFSVTQSTTPGGIEKAEEKSILLEFNGSTLSKVVSEIKTANYSAEDTIMIRMTDTTPLDNNVDDLVIYADKNGKEAEYPLNYLPDEGVNRDRSEFKKEFYLKLIEDFFVHVLRLQEMQSQHSSRNQKKLLQSYKESLEY